MARRGWLRCYILYCKDVPVAFMVGYHYEDCFFYIDVGYDPQWAQYSVGSVLHLEVMDDLYRRGNAPVLFISRPDTDPIKVVSERNHAKRSPCFYYQTRQVIACLL